MDATSILKSYLAALRQRYLFVLIPAVVLFVAVCAVTYVLPERYQSTARILVESQQIPTDLARSTVTANASERVQLIKQRLMTRDNLLAVARKFNLYGDLVRQAPSEVVDRMRDAARIDQVDIGNARTRGPAQTVAFTVSYTYTNATIASRVTNEFVTLILEQNIEGRTQRATETSRFFAQQVAGLEKELATLGSRIVEFKSTNAALLPDTLDLRREQIRQLITEQTQIATKLNELGQRGNGASVSPVDPSSDNRRAELDRLHTQLVQLRGVYSDTHPNVRAIRQQISSLENASQIIARKLDTAPPLSPGESERSVLRSQIQELEAAQVKAREQVERLEESIRKTPQVEITLASLNREYELVQQQLNQARAKMADAEIGERLEADRQAERLEVIEQASVPTEPTSPNRPLLFAGGAAGSFVAGLGILFAAELLNPRIRTSGDLLKHLQLRPLVTIPLVVTPQERARRRRKGILLVILLLSALVGIFTAVHMFYAPLDVLLITLMRSLRLS